MIRKRVIAWLTLCLMISAVFMPCFAAVAYAKDGGFSFSYDTDHEYNVYSYLTENPASYGDLLSAYFKGAGDIKVTQSADGFNFVLPAYSSDWSGTTEMGERTSYVEGGSMSFSAPLFEIQTDADHYYLTYGVETYGTLFTLDAPVTVTQELVETNRQGTETFEYNTRSTITKVEMYMTILREEDDGTVKLYLNTGDNRVSYEYDYKVTHTTDFNTGSTESESGSNSGECQMTVEATGYYYARGLDVSDPNSGAAPGKEGDTAASGKQEVTRDADENAGEMGTDISSEIVEGNDKPGATDAGGLSTPGAIAVGVGGGAAGVAGGIAAANALKGNGEEAEEEKKKRYRMYVGKDFGDSIRKGAPPVKLSARIVEIGPDNIERTRPDLSKGISVSGSGINIASAVVTDACMEAGVYADEDSALREGTVSFIYAGEGGTFKNNIVFKLTGKPYLRFPEVSAGGQSWVLNAIVYVDIIAGDRRTYPVMFYFEDAVSEPKILRFDKDDELEVTYREADRLHTYYADIVNNTAPYSDDDTAFPEITEKTVHIYAEFENGDVAEGDINLRIYPEGLVIKADPDRMKDGRMLLNAYEDNIYYGDDVDPTPRFIPTRLKVMLAVSTDEGAEIIDGDEANTQFGAAVGDGGPGEGLSEKLEYEISNVGAEYTIVSKKAFVEADEPLYIKLPVACEYQGEIYDKEIPVRVIGTKPEPISHVQKEYRKLIYAVKRFIDDGERRYYWIMLIKERMSDGQVSAYTLRMMWWSVYYEYYDYETAIGAGHRFEAAVFDWMVSGAEWTKWVCGVAFSYCADAFAGNPVGSAFIQMGYETVMDSIEELTACVINGRSFNYKNLNGYKHLMDAGDNIAGDYVKNGVMDAFKDGYKGTATLKKAAMCIGAYMGYMVYKNLNKIYDEKGEWDIPGAIYESFKDMTVNAFKMIAGELFGNWMESKKFQTEAGKIVSDAAKEVFKKYRTLRPVEWDALGGKFVEEFVGGGVGFVIDHTELALGSMEMDFTAENHVVVKFKLAEEEGKKPIYMGIDLTRSLQYMAAGAFSPFMILYDAIFGNLVGAEGAVSFPEDPKEVRRNRMIARVKVWDIKPSV